MDKWLWVMLIGVIAQFTMLITTATLWYGYNIPVPYSMGYTSLGVAFVVAGIGLFKY